MVGRILVPIVGSEHAESALSLACTHASTSDAEITLLRVVEYPSELYSGIVYSRFYPNPVAEPGPDEKIRAKGEDRNPWMMGATANHILREAKVPVILMRKAPGGSVPDRSSLQDVPLQKSIESQYEYSR